MDSSNPAPISAKALTFLVRITWHQNARLGQCLGPNQEWQALTLLLPSPLQLPFPSWSRRQKGLAWLMALDRLPHLGAADNLRQASEGLGLTMTNVLGVKLHQQSGVHIPIRGREIHDFSFRHIHRSWGVYTSTFVCLLSKEISTLYKVKANYKNIQWWREMQPWAPSVRPNTTQAAPGSAVYAYGNQPVDGRRKALRGYLPFPLPKGEDAFKYIRPESFYILPPTCSSSKALTQGAGCHLLGH